MAAPKQCESCDAVTFHAYLVLISNGWTVKPLDHGQEAWRCPTCSTERRVRRA